MAGRENKKKKMFHQQQVIKKWRFLTTWRREEEEDWTWDKMSRHRPCCLSWIWKWIIFGFFFRFTVKSTHGELARRSGNWKKNLQDFTYTILVSRLGIKFFGDTGLVRSAEIVLILLPATLRQRSASFFSSTPKIGVSLCVFATV